MIGIPSLRNSMLERKFYNPTELDEIAAGLDELAKDPESRPYFCQISQLFVKKKTC